MSAKRAASPRGRCRRCNAPILWARTTATGKHIPLDPQPVDRGNVVLGQDGKGQLTARVLARDAVGPGLYVSHFATCSARPRGASTTTSGATP